MGVVGSHGSFNFASFSVSSSSLTMPYSVLMYWIRLYGWTCVNPVHSLLCDSMNLWSMLMRIRLVSAARPAM